MKNSPLIKTIPYSSNGLDLVKIFAHEPGFFFLDSSLHHPNYGRYSILGFDPFDIFSSREKDCLDKLKQKYSNIQTSSSTSHLPFDSGMVGFLSYDYGLAQEAIPLQKRQDLGLPYCWFGFYDLVLVVDHFEQKLFIVSSGLPEPNSVLQHRRAQERLNQTIQRIEQGPAVKNLQNVDEQQSSLQLTSNFTKEEYIQAVQQALAYIGAGDIYQVNLSQRFQFYSERNDLKPLDVYLTLRDLSPSSFASYLNAGDFQIMSSSPERFLYLKDRLLQTRPMKGTRPRGDSSTQDQKLRDEIINSEKDKAELLMITDLERNDIGKVCEYGSVRVRHMREIEEYKTVFQATSTVEGVVREDQDVFDVLKACFPGGSITGCPKIRAMEIIEELEPSRRDIYTGALGYIGFDGRMDFNILIRTLLAHEQKIYFHAGGGIVADSNPEDEYQETLVKAKAMHNALAQVFSPSNMPIQK